MKYVVEGGKRLKGEIDISGSKNAALPILATSLLNPNEVTFYNVPKIEDVKITLMILRKLGCKINIKCDKITISSKNVRINEIPKDLMNKARSTVVLAGALIGRFRNATFYYPGGCNIGKRPIDIHLEGFKKLGVNVKFSDNKIECKANILKSNRIKLNFPSVGATENIILASVYIKGTTYIYNAAREPEIKDLANCLNKMGAKIYGAGSNKIVIVGVAKLKSAVYRIMPDRIEAGTYLCAAAITNGKIKINNVNSLDLVKVLYKLKEIGCKIYINNNSIKLFAPKIINSTNIETLPYPGFPTDMQPIFSTVLCKAKGISYIKENIFESRLEFCNELKKMGANIRKIDNNKVAIYGVNTLKGAKVEAKDLRGGASLIVAALASENTTTIENASNILRGYENIEKKLNSLGANVKVL